MSDINLECRQGQNKQWFIHNERTKERMTGGHKTKEKAWECCAKRLASSLALVRTAASNINDVEPDQ